MSDQSRITLQVSLLPGMRRLWRHPGVWLSSGENVRTYRISIVRTMSKYIELCITPAWVHMTVLWHQPRVMFKKVVLSRVITKLMWMKYEQVCDTSALGNRHWDVKYRKIIEIYRNKPINSISSKINDNNSKEWFSNYLNLSDRLLNWCFLSI